MIRKSLLLIIAILLSLLLSEFVVSNLVGFPKFGVSYKVRYRKGGAVWTNIKKPYSSILNVEGKRITELNNFGLPGGDIVNFDNPIVLLGSSYIEAFQFSPVDIASTRFEKLIQEYDRSYGVINLGCSGHDPYDSYFRLKYYEQLLSIKPDNVVLVINSDNRGWFTRHHRPLDFSKPSDFATINRSKSITLQLKLRNTSSLAELFVKGLLKQSSSEDGDSGTENEDGKKNPAPVEIPEVNAEMMDCLRQFNRQYSNFIVVSVYDNVDYNLNLQHLCEKEGINFFWKALTKPENLINNAGHFNLKGNKELAIMLKDAFISSKQFQLAKGVTNVLQ